VRASPGAGSVIVGAAASPSRWTAVPVINGYWERAEFPFALMEKMAALGIIGDGIDDGPRT
jgi:hypothetical protein